MKLSRRVLFGAAAVAVAGAGGAVAWDQSDRVASVQADTSGVVTKQELDRAAARRVFFGHQSVGENVISGLVPAFARQGAMPPVIADLTSPAIKTPRGAGAFLHAFVGTNTDPLGKLADFDARLRGGLSEEIDAALVKFCYVDVDRNTDIDQLFVRYTSTLELLIRDYPKVDFWHSTVPLMARPGLLARLRGSVTTTWATYCAEDNLARERYNAKIRAKHRGRLFDLAAIESTTPTGSRVEGRVAGQVYYSLYPGFASDSGHLNAGGSELAAAHLLALLGEGV